MHKRYYFEDFTPGWRFENGPRRLSAEEIVAAGFIASPARSTASPYYPAKPELFPAP